MLYIYYTYILILLQNYSKQVHCLLNNSNKQMYIAPNNAFKPAKTKKEQSLKNIAKRVF